MPRPKRSQKAHIDLAGLIERAQLQQQLQQQQQYQQQQHQRAHSRRPSKIYSRPTRTHMFAEAIRSRHMRSRQMSRNTVIGVGSNAVWNTLVQPISLLQWLPMRRSFRYRRSYRSRSRRSQKSSGGGLGGSGSSGGGGANTNYGTPKIGSQSRMPQAEVEMPCCATESPTAEVQLITTCDDYSRLHNDEYQNSNVQQQPQQYQHHHQHQNQVREDNQEQPCESHTFTPPLSTVILHQNPLFDAEGNTRSGLITKNMQRQDLNKAKSRWNVRGGGAGGGAVGVDRTSPKQKLSKSLEPQDAAKKKKKGGAEKRVPAKKGSGSDESSAASMNASNSHSTVDSGASSEKSKSDTEESNSFEESIDLTMHDAIGLHLDNSNPRNMLQERAALMEAINGGSAESDATAIKPKNFETMLAK